jgi:hypothetical protein
LQTKKLGGSLLERPTKRHDATFQGFPLAHRIRRLDCPHFGERRFARQRETDQAFCTTRLVDD